MAENDQHLKHGKALCGKVFGRFVETFNALVDFMLGIKGDADNKNGEGHITYDRKNNIIRCTGCGGGENGGDTVPLPWTFSCTEDPDTGERTGGWTNGLAQFGYDRIFITPDLLSSHTFGYIVVNGTDTTDDGHHYLEVNTLVGTAEVKVGEHVPSHDPKNGIIRIGLGFVKDHNLKSAFHHNPVIYKYV